MTKSTLKREISKYLKIQFISDTKLLPEDECDGEAKHILSLVKQRIEQVKNPYSKADWTLPLTTDDVQEHRLWEGFEEARRMFKESIR